MPRYSHRITVAFTEELRQALVKRLWAHQVTGHTDALTSFVASLLHHEQAGSTNPIYLETKEEAKARESK